MTKKVIIDEITMQRTISRMTYEIIEKNKELKNVVLIGIETRGIYIARRIKERLQNVENITLPIGKLDTRPYRDDIKATEDNSKILIDLKGKEVILVDDVLYTGRTIRAAIDGLMNFGRPAAIQLAVLVDRGHRELPIRADYVGKNIPTSHDEKVIVHMTEVDGEDAVSLESKEN